MKLYVLFATHKGEETPEALDCMDEYSYTENPEHLHDKMDDLKKQSHIQQVEIVEIEVDMKEVYKRFQMVKTTGKVV